jgi:uncharacterized membrane protein YebE (DUF533 family)
MFDPQKLLDQFLGTSPDGRPGIAPETLKGLAGGAAAGGLAAILLGSDGGRKLAGSALKLGGAAVLGGIAYRAWQNWQASKGAATTVPMKDITPAGQAPAMLPAGEPARNELSLALIRAMIAAAKADGHIDATEQKHIFAKLDDLALDTEAKAFVVDELRKPLDVDSVVAAATTPETAMEIYTASVLAIDPDDPAERAYLAMLASRLKLDPGLAATIETEVKSAVART